MTNSGIYFNQFNGYTDRWEEKNKFPPKSVVHNKAFSDVAKLEERPIKRNMVQDKLESLRGQATLEEDKSALESSKQEEDSKEEESKTDTQILVRPDGSRVLLIKVMVAGMETTVSLKLSEATKMQNDSHFQEEESVEGSEMQNDNHFQEEESVESSVGGNLEIAGMSVAWVSE